jgi:hypothetical protein
MTGLRDTSAALRREAVELLDRTGLLRLLGQRFGGAEIVGSCALDLMTWRDIDVYVPVERSGKAAFLSLIGAFEDFAGYRLVKAIFNDEWAQPRGDYGSGYYWGLRVQTPDGEMWKIDLWGWDRETYSRKLDEHRRLAEALDACDRDTLLKLKAQAMQLPGFRDTITSNDIYRMVLSGAGSTIGGLLPFCANARPSPSASS